MKYNGRKRIGHYTSQTAKRRRGRVNGKLRRRLFTGAVLYARISPRPGQVQAALINGECMEAEDPDRERKVVDSLPLQLNMGRRWARARGLQIFGEFTDDKISGCGYDDRQGLRQAVKLACRLKAVLVVYNQSRLSRNFLLLLKIIAKIDRASAGIKTLSGLSLDTSQATHEMQLAFKIIALVDEYRRIKDAEITSEMMFEHQRNGLSMSSQAPYGSKRLPHPDGLTHEDGRPIYILQPEPTEQAAIAYLRQLCQRPDRGNVLWLINRLVEAGHKPRGKEWSRHTIRAIIDREGLLAEPKDKIDLEGE